MEKFFDLKEMRELREHAEKLGYTNLQDYKKDLSCEGISLNEAYQLFVKKDTKTDEKIREQEKLFEHPNQNDFDQNENYNNVTYLMDQARKKDKTSNRKKGTKNNLATLIELTNFDEDEQIGKRISNYSSNDNFEDDSNQVDEHKLRKIMGKMAAAVLATGLIVGSYFQMNALFSSKSPLEAKIYDDQLCLTIEEQRDCHYIDDLGPSFGSYWNNRTDQEGAHAFF